jgi:hypothetical protein
MRSVQTIRVDSRNFLKFLIVLNLLIFTYQLIGFDLIGYRGKSTVPCVVMVDSSPVRFHSFSDSLQFEPQFSDDK